MKRGMHMKKHGARLAALVLLFSIVMVQTGCSRNLLETVRSWVRVGDVECTVSSPRYYASGELSPEAPLDIQVEIRYVGLGEPSEVEVIRGGSYYLPTLYVGEEDAPIISSSLSAIAVQDTLHRDQPYTDAWTARKEYEELGGFAPGDYRARIFWDFTYTDASGINRNVKFSSEICFTVL